MKKLIFTLFVMMGFYYITYSQELTTIEPELQQEMISQEKGEMISINIILKSQYDQMEMRRKSNAFKTKENKRSFVINELKRFSKESQIGILNELQSFERNLKVQNIKSHWIFNGINCMATPEAIEAIASNPDVLIIGFNREQHLLPEGEKPTVSDATRELTYNILKVNADDVWGLGFTGEGVIIAVIDTGVNYNHVDLADHMWIHPDFPYHGYDCNGNDNNPMDDMGHGTHCAGTVCGDGTAGSQTGMAPDATLMAIKVLDADGNGNINDICEGVEFAVEHGAHVFSMSLGFASGGTNSERIQFRNTMINTLEAGVVGAVAAGNEGDQLYMYPVPNNVRVPGNCPPPWLHPDQTITGGLTCVVCVGSTDQNDNASYFTSRGPVTWQSVTGFNDYAYNPGIGLIRPDVCAPGSNIKSLNYQGNSGYTDMSGTSMATPCVAGVMGLMLSKNIELTPAEIDEILETTAAPLSTSKSNTFGSGRIDALAAVEEVVVGPVIFHSYILTEIEGNQDGVLNPGETVSLTVSMENIFDVPVNGVVVEMTSENSHVTIHNGNAIFGNFASGEIITMENIFSFTIDESSPAKQNIQLLFTASAAEETCVTRCKIMVYDYMLEYGSMVVNDTETGNGNGILEAGETADLQIYVNNKGNAFASSLTGTLSTTFSDLTINTNQQSHGSLLADQAGFASYNVTLSENIPENEIIIPFTLIVNDKFERETECTFTYQNKCNVIFDLHDSFGDGWNGASINVSFDDGTPSRNLTVSGGSVATHTVEINGGATVTLSWTSGNYDYECSFTVAYEDGGEIYNSSSSPSSGVFFSWTNNCSGGGTVAGTCQHVDNLIANNEGYNAILNWDAAETAETYRVYRNYELVANNITTTTYTDTDLEAGDYCFTITAVCEDDEETNPSNEVCISIASCNAPELSATPVDHDGEAAILLEWNSLQNAQLYTIFKDEVVTATTTDTHLLITDIEWNEEYCFTITSTCETGESSPSNAVCETVFFCYSPENLTATAENQNIELTWNIAENANSYNIYRDGTEIANNINKPFFTDENLEIGNYLYKVTSNCEIGESDFSNEAHAEIVSINELNSRFNIFPNPANHELTIEGENIESIAIYNVVGQLIKNIKVTDSSSQKIITSSFENGVYILRITTKNGSMISEHIVITH